MIVDTLPWALTIIAIIAIVATLIALSAHYNHPW